MIAVDRFVSCRKTRYDTNDVKMPSTTSFNHVDEHYAYTLPHGDDVTADNNVLDPDDDQLDDLDEVMQVEDDKMPRFDSIT